MHFGNSKAEGGGGQNMEAICGMVWIFSGIAQLKASQSKT